jgi:hypothetical protein
MAVKRLNNKGMARPDFPVFCRVRNEIYLLTHFLRHYRALGIEHFFFADDKSDDGSREFLLEQPDCTVLDADFRFNEMVGDTQGKDIALCRMPLTILGEGWILSVDTDEFLILPEPYSSVPELARDLDRRGKISCIASMVDFYPHRLIDRTVDRSVSPFEAYPFFDVGPYFIWREGELGPHLIFGGVRHRINDWMFQRDPGKVWQHYRPTMLQKVPLIRWGTGMTLESPHHANLPPFTGIQVALAHFKFHTDLDLKIMDGIESGFYQASSYYYRLLRKYMPVFEDRSLLALTSRRYREPADLVRANLMYVDGPPF